MRFTNRLCRGVNVHRQFTYSWVKNRQVTINPTSAESVLASKGIEVVDIKDAIRPALIEEPFTPLVEEMPVLEEKPLCYTLRNSFIPLGLSKQCQLITKTLMIDTFPNTLLNKVEESSAEEQKLVEKIVLKSNLLDGEQQKLPRELDVINLPGYKPRREYNIPKIKKIHSTLQHMFLAIETKSSSKDNKYILQKMPSKVALNHSDGIMQMNHQSDFLVCSKTALPPVAGLEEVSGFDQTPLPDLYPLSPFLHADAYTNYDLRDEYALAGGPLKPHTVLMSYHPSFRSPRIIKPDQFQGMTLVYAFSYAASYAKERDKGAMGDLKEPVTINIVHTNGKLFHTGIFQLNTLDFKSERKNLFWHEPLESIYEAVRYDVAKPIVEGLNTRPYRLLKALLS